MNELRELGNSSLVLCYSDLGGVCDAVCKAQSTLE